MFNTWEWVGLLAVVLIFAGGKKLPEIGQGLGKGISEFRKAIGGEPDKEKPAEAPPKAHAEEKKSE